MELLRKRILVAAMCLSLGAACGLDSANRSGSGGGGGGAGAAGGGDAQGAGTGGDLFPGVPDIAGTWRGQFINGATGDDYFIDVLAIFPPHNGVGGSTYKFDFVVKILTEDGIEPIAFFIYGFLAEGFPLGIVDDIGVFALSTGETGVFMRGQIIDENRIEGDWLLDAKGIQVVGPWFVDRVSDDFPVDPPPGGDGEEGEGEG